MHTPAEWSAALRRFEGDQPSHHGRLVHEILRALAEDTHPLATLKPTEHGFSTVLEIDGLITESDEKPTAAKAAVLYNNAFFRFAIVHGFLTLRRAGLVEFDRPALLRDMVEYLTRATSQAILRISPSSPRDANGAPAFFSYFLRPLLPTLKSSGGVDLVGRAASLDGTPESVERWNRVWTAACIIETVDWLQRVPLRNRSFSEIVGVIWSGLTGPKDVQKKFQTLKGSALPTSTLHYPADEIKVEKGKATSLKLLVACRLILAQLIEFDPALVGSSYNHTYEIPFAMRKLYSNSHSGIEYYSGFNVLQIRFAVLAEALFNYGLELSRAERPAMRPLVPDLGPAGENPALLTCLQIIEEHRLLQDGEAALGPGQLALAPSNSAFPESLSHAGAPTCFLQPDRFHFRLTGDVSSLEQASAIRGEIRLEDALNNHCAWVELVCVVKIAGEYHELGAEVESVDTQEDDESRYFVVIQPTPTMPRDRLQRALVHDSTWAYQRAGLGLFIVVLMELYLHTDGSTAG